MRANALVVWTAAVAGCSSNGSGSGAGFSVAGAISAAVTMSDGNGDTSSSAWIVLASTSNPCADAGASPPIDRKGQRYMTISLADVAAGVGSTPTVAGTYAIYMNTGSQPPKEALVNVGGFDTSCMPVDADAATGETGTVTLSAITGNVFSGSYDVVLNTGSTIKGSFAPVACPALATELASMTQHSCE